MVRGYDDEDDGDVVDDDILMFVMMMIIVMMMMRIQRLGDVFIICLFNMGWLSSHQL